ncbi:2-dehydropantoate 2-reductase [Roseomonas sp. F4]
MRILILGAGALGGYYGLRLAEAGAEPRFLVRPGRARQLVEQGLRLQSGGALLQRPVHTVLSAAESGPADLILLTCKAYDLPAAIEAIAPAMAPHSLVLPLLNGLAHLDALDQRFGADRVLGGVAYIAATLGADGLIHHTSPADTLVFGARDGRQAAAMAALAEAFAATPVAARLSDDILQELWEKWCMLAAGAALCCLMRGTVGDVMATTHGAALAQALLEEARAVAAAVGHPPRPAAAAQATRMLTDPASRWAASMMRDLEAGAPRLEADHILGDLIRRAETASISVKLIEAAYCQLQVHAARQAAR